MDRRDETLISSAAAAMLLLHGLMVYNKDIGNGAINFLLIMDAKLLLASITSELKSVTHKLQDIRF